MLNMLHVGASRAGSTWLWRALDRHPQTVFPIWGPNAPNGRKSGWFWNNASPYWKDDHFGKVKTRAVLTLDEYRHYYDPSEEGKIKIDITEGAAYIPESRIQLIHQTYPDAKITYCIRNPITTIWSHMKYSGIYGNSHDFFKLIGGNYIKNVEYIKNLKTWKRYFSDDQIKVYFFSEIAENPIKILKQLSAYLDIDPDFWDTEAIDEISKKQNPNKNKNNMLVGDKEVIVQRCSNIIKEIEDYFEKDLTHWYEGEE